MASATINQLRMDIRVVLSIHATIPIVVSYVETFPNDSNPNST